MGWKAFGPTWSTELWDRLNSSRLGSPEREWVGTSVSWFESRWSIPREAESSAPLATEVIVLFVKYNSLRFGDMDESKPVGSILEMVFLSRCNTKRFGSCARARRDGIKYLIINTGYTAIKQFHIKVWLECLLTWSRESREPIPIQVQIR